MTGLYSFSRLTNGTPLLYKPWGSSR
jgi:hypothetical protein